MSVDDVSAHCLLTVIPNIIFVRFSLTAIIINYNVIGSVPNQAGVPIFELFLEHAEMTSFKAHTAVGPCTYSLRVFALSIL